MHFVETTQRTQLIEHRLVTISETFRTDNTISLSIYKIDSLLKKKLEAVFRLHSTWSRL